MRTGGSRGKRRSRRRRPVVTVPKGQTATREKPGNGKRGMDGLDWIDEMG